MFSSGKSKDLFGTSSGMKPFSFSGSLFGNSDKNDVQKDDKSSLFGDSKNNSTIDFGSTFKSNEKPDETKSLFDSKPEKKEEP